MLTVFANGVGYPISNDDYYIRQLASGLDEIVFNVSIRDAVFKYIVEEAIVRDRDQQEYVIKQIDAGNDKAKVVAQINIDDWKRTLYMNYSNESDTVDNTITRIAPQGWSVIDRSQKSIRRTIPTSDKAKDYNVTPWEIVTECCNTYSIRVRIDTVNKYLYIINPQLFTNIGAFATRDLNLRSLNYKGKSENFATRLYAIGAEGMTFASINDGKPYVDNFTYSDKIIEAYWKDERYTDKYSLLADAQARLAEMATPSRSYDCDILDLANTNPDIYGFENFELFNIVTLIDDAQERRLDYQIVEKWEYPYYPAKNKVILSTKTPNIQTIVSSVVNAVNSPVSAFSQKIQSAMNIMTQLVTGNEGGYVVLNDSDADGYPDEILVMDTPSIATAVKVWRWNNAGLGFSSTGYNGTYTLGLNMLGQINADMITAGHLNGEVISGGSISINALSEEAKNAIAALHSYIPENVLASINNWQWTTEAEGLVSIEAVDGVNCLVLDGTGIVSENQDTYRNYRAKTSTSLYGAPKITISYDFMVDHTVTIDLQLDWQLTYRIKDTTTNSQIIRSSKGTFEAGHWYTYSKDVVLNEQISNTYPCMLELYFLLGTKKYIKNLSLSSTLDNYVTSSFTFTDDGLKLVSEKAAQDSSMEYIAADALTNPNRWTFADYSGGTTKGSWGLETVEIEGSSKKALMLDGTNLVRANWEYVRIEVPILGTQNYHFSYTLFIGNDFRIEASRGFMYFRSRKVGAGSSSLEQITHFNTGSYVQGQVYKVSYDATYGDYDPNYPQYIEFYLPPTGKVYIADLSITSSISSNLKATMQFNADGLCSIVQKGDIISSINQSAEAVTINASKIDLTGNLNLKGEFKANSAQYTNVSAELKNGALKIEVNDDLLAELGFISSSSGDGFSGRITLYGPENNYTSVDDSGLFTNYGSVTCRQIYVNSGGDTSHFNGNVEFGYYGDNRPTVKFLGDVYNSAGGLQFISDRRKKRSIKDLAISKARSFIMGLKPCKFKFIKEISTSDRYHHGFIAQEVKEAMPEDWGLYCENKDLDFIGLRYDEIIADLVKVVQDQEKRIESLEMEIKRAKEKSK